MSRNKISKERGEFYMAAMNKELATMVSTRETKLEVKGKKMIATISYSPPSFAKNDVRKIAGYVLPSDIILEIRG